MKSFILTIVITLAAFTAFCQQKGANISFDTETFSFGKIEEIKGAVTHVYNFTNTGSEPLVLQNVQPSCGCTTPEWSKKPVVPGGKGFIKATFDPAGRPGSFAKSITVVSNAVNSPVVLKFTGEVIGKAPAIEEKYSFSIDNLRVASTYLAFGKISSAKTASKTIDVLNGGSTPIALSFPTVAPYLEILVSPSTIRPGQKASITINYDAKKKNDWGFVAEEILFTMNGKKDAKYKFNLTADIQDDYSQATPQQIANTPRMTMEKTVVDVGRIKNGTQVELVYRFKNLGKSNLEIHKIFPSCGCTNIKVSEKIIKPGQTGEIKGIYNSTGQKGAVNKTISVYTNDPQHLNLTLWIRGNVD